MVAHLWLQHPGDRDGISIGQAGQLHWQNRQPLVQPPCINGSLPRKTYNVSLSQPRSHVLVHPNTYKYAHVHVHTHVCVREHAHTHARTPSPTFSTRKGKAGEISVSGQPRLHYETLSQNTKTKTVTLPVSFSSLLGNTVELHLFLFIFSVNFYLPILEDLVPGFECVQP